MGAYRFQGQYHDHETGLHYNRYRYYDPRVGRFISKDPISYAGGLNLYAYAPNPVGWVDPLGLAPCPCLDGGSFKDMDAKRKVNEVGHHMPQNAYNKTIDVSRNNGPAVLMTTDAHAEARTFSGRGKASMRKDGEAELNARQRLALDIKYLRALYGTKCNSASLKAIAYAKTRPEYAK